MTGSCRARAGWALAVVAIIALAQGSSAQQPSTSAAATASTAQGARPPDPRAGLSTVMSGDDLLVQRRQFTAGNRTYWHTHERGFLILVESGRARVQKKGEPMRELKPGEVDYTPPGVPHWHGAAPDSDFVQVGVSFGGAIDFTEPVTDAEYQGK